MPGTFEAVIAALVAVLPGALAVWGFERISGRWAIGLSDRLLRFLGISAVLHALAAPITYTLWREYFSDGARTGVEPLPLWLWAVALGYVVVPLALGSGLAWAGDNEASWTKWAVGNNPAPTAWDAVFSSQPTGAYVLMKLKSGRWVGGQFVEGSYVGGYPEPADIYLLRELKVDQSAEDFAVDAGGNHIQQGSYGLLVRWEEIEFLEVSD